MDSDFNLSSSHAKNVAIKDTWRYTYCFLCKIICTKSTQNYIQNLIIMLLGFSHIDRELLKRDFMSKLCRNRLLWVRF